MPRYLHFNHRTSGRDLLAVRRPGRAVRVVGAVAVPEKPETLKKAELVALAEASGVDASGTKAEIAERLSDDG